MANTERIDELKRRVQMDPASIAFAALAEEYRREGRFEEAIATCSTGLRRHPSYLSAHVTLGRAWASLGRIDEARAEFEHVLRLAPENLAAIRALAEIHNATETAAEPRLVHEAGPVSAAIVACRLAPPEIKHRLRSLSQSRNIPRACRQHSWGSNTSSTRSLARGARTPTSSAPALADRSSQLFAWTPLLRCRSIGVYIESARTAAGPAWMDSSSRTRPTFDISPDSAPRRERWF